MTEPSFSVDSFLGTGIYSILWRDITVHLNPTSPIDSNMSSIGTLEFLFLPVCLHLTVHHASEDDLFDLMAIIGPIRREKYSRTAGISSTRMAAFATFVG